MWRGGEVNNPFLKQFRCQKSGFKYILFNIGLVKMSDGSRTPSKERERSQEKAEKNKLFITGLDPSVLVCSFRFPMQSCRRS